MGRSVVINTDSTGNKLGVLVGDVLSLFVDDVLLVAAAQISGISYSICFLLRDLFLSLISLGSSAALVQFPLPLLS